MGKRSNNYLHLLSAIAVLIMLNSSVATVVAVDMGAMKRNIEKSGKFQGKGLKGLCDAGLPTFSVIEIDALGWLTH